MCVARYALGWLIDGWAALRISPAGGDLLSLQAVFMHALVSVCWTLTLYHRLLRATGYWEVLVR